MLSGRASAGGAANVRFSATADIVRSWPETVCPLMTQSGHLVAMSEGATEVSCYERKEDARAD